MLGAERLWRRVALTIACLLILSACSKKEAAGEDSGHRIAALSPAIAQSLRDLGLGDDIVGRHGFDAWTDQAVPVAGDQGGIDYEMLARIRPTHIFVEWGAREVPRQLAALAEERGCTLRSYSFLTLDQIRDGILSLARDIDSTDQDLAKRAVSLQARFADSCRPRAVESVERCGRVLLLGALSPLSALGPGSAHHDLAQRMGLNVVPQTGAPYITLDSEDIMAIAPDSIIILMPRNPSAAVGSRAGRLSVEDQEALLGSLSKGDVPAIRHGRIAVVDHPMCLLPCTALIEVADQLERCINEISEAADDDQHNPPGVQSPPRG